MTEITEVMYITLLEDLCNKYRKIVAEEHGITDNNFSGMCYIVSSDIVEWMNTHLTEIKSTAKANLVHGEIQHKFGVLSENWLYQHTWLELVTETTTYYVDPTAGQFKFIFPDIPDIYVSTTPPKWYLPDRKNILFRHRYPDPIFNLMWQVVYCVWGGFLDVIYLASKPFRAMFKLCI